MESLAEKLIRYRIKAGYLTPRDFAEAVGIPYSTYITYEAGRRTTPRLSTLAKIAAFLKIDQTELLPDSNMDSSLMPDDALENILIRCGYQIQKVPDTKKGYIISKNDLVLALTAKEYSEFLKVLGESIFDFEKAIANNTFKSWFKAK